MVSSFNLPTASVLIFIAILLSACDQTPRNPNVDDSPTYGRAVVLADEGLKLILQDQQMVFNSIYPDAEVVVYYMPEAQLTKAMLNDSVRVVFGAFRPGGEQEAYFRTRSLSVQEEPVATDAIAVVVAKTSELERVSKDQLVDLLSGGNGALKGASVLFDLNGSGVPRTLVDSLLGGDVSRLKRGAAANGIEDLLTRVASDPKAIGFIPYAMISDQDNAACRALVQHIRVIPVSNTDASPAFMPDQGTLKDGSYPLRRKMIMVVTEGKSGLGTGFASFVAGHKGQRILLKQGLAPERTPSRDVEIVQPGQ